METGSSKSERDRCGNLRWKGMFIDVSYDTSISQSSEHVCWCVLTQGPVGPDGQVAEEETCNLFRSCYVTV